MQTSSEIYNTRYHLMGVILALTGTLFFSAKSILIKKVYALGLDVESVMVLRTAMAAPFYLLIYFLSARRGARMSYRDFGAILAIGVLGYYVASYLDLQGLVFISASFERMILYLFPSFVLFISVVFLKHKLKTSEVLAAALSYLGILLIYVQDLQSAGHDATRGMLLVLGSALAFSLFVVLSGHYIVKAGATRFTSISMSGASVAVLTHYTVNGAQDMTAYDSQAYLIMLALALFCTVLPSYLINMGIKRIGAPRVAILGTVSPMFTVLMAYLFLNEVSTLMHVAGFALVISGIAVITLTKQKPVQVSPQVLTVAEKR